MKKRLCAVLLLMLLPLWAAAEEEVEIEEIVEEVNLDAVAYGDVAWNFPLALEEMNPEYIRLANKHYLLEKDYAPDDLVKVPRDPKKGGIYWAVSGTDGKLKGQNLRAECAEALCAMNADMRQQEGFRNMYLKSSYRSWSKQNTMYKNRLKKNKGRDDGWVSMPGASDHQTGLGCDVVPSNWKDRGMNEKMMQEKECQWMAEHCHEYGFIIRYPADKQELTEINTEPWHLRYVGVKVAAYMKENNLCLEEFTMQLQEAIGEFLENGGNPAAVEAYVQTPTEENET